MIGATDLFFMDETSLYLNDTMRRAWGTTEHLAEIKKAKGKTVTIQLYAGLGMVHRKGNYGLTWQAMQEDDSRNDFQMQVRTF